MTSLSILDVGHGNAAVLHSADDAIVIDAGRGVGLLEYLRENNIVDISTVLISHADADHLKGLVALLGVPEINIRQVRLNSDAAKDSRQWKALVYDLADRRRAGEIDFSPSLVEGERFTLGAGPVWIEICGPSPALAAIGPGGTDKDGRRIGTNTISAVVRILRDENPLALLPGDLDETGLSSLEEFGVEIASSLLVFPHHGGNVTSGGGARNEVFADLLCRLVHPASVVFSMGRGGLRNPRPEIVASVKRTLPDVRILCTELSQNCAAEVPEEPAEHILDMFAQGRRGNCCCAGSVLLDIETEAVWPNVEEHSAFIDTFVPVALCRKPIP